MAARYGGGAGPAATAAALLPQYDTKGGDDSKYDSRRFKQQLKWLQRGALVVVVVLAVVILSGDTLMWRSKRRAARALQEADAEVFARRVRGSVKVDRFSRGGDANGDEEDTGDEAFVVDGDEERSEQEAEESGEGRPRNRGPDAVLSKEDEDALQAVWGEGGERNNGDGPPAAQPPNGMGWGEQPEYGGEDPEDRHDAGKGDPASAARPVAGVGANVGDGGDAVDPPTDWSLNPTDQCARYFGNGYEEVFQLTPPPSQAGAAGLACRRHAGTTAVLCSGRSLIMYPSRITMSQGGEDVTAVLGRAEEAEVPRFSDGAFEVYMNGDFDAQNESGDHPGDALAAVRSSNLPRVLERVDKFKLDMLNAMRVVDASQPGQQRGCGRRVREPVIFLTRMEYANLFHTSTDWYNAWSTARIAAFTPTTEYRLTKLTPSSLVGEDGVPKLPVHVIFLDGHNASPMDEGWTALFLSVSYAKHFTTSVCFDEVLFAPFGYQSALSMGLQPLMHSCGNSAHVRQFSNDMVRGLGLLPRATAMCHLPSTPVLFVRRTHYLAHPRHDGKIVRRLDNEDDIMDALVGHAANADAGVRVLNGLFSGMTLRQQVEMAQDACVMVGAHGAGLTHILFSPPGVHMLELQPPAFQRPHFISYSMWAGSHSHIWPLSTSTPNPSEVVARIQQTVAAAAVDERAARVAQAERGGHRAHLLV